MDKEGILYLIGLLPGEVGNKYREKAANLVRRYAEAPCRKILQSVALVVEITESLKAY